MKNPTIQPAPLPVATQVRHGLRLVTARESRAAVRDEAEFAPRIDPDPGFERMILTLLTIVFAALAVANVIW